MLETKRISSALQGVEFNEVPYDTHGRFAIYAPKPKSYLIDLLRRTTGSFKHEEPSRPDSAASQTTSKLSNKLRREVEEARVHNPETVEANNTIKDNNASQIQDPESQAKFDEWQRANHQAELRSAQLDKSEKGPTHSILKRGRNRSMFEATDNLNRSVGSRANDSHVFVGDAVSIASAKKSMKSNATFRSRSSRRSKATSFRDTLYFDTRTQSIPKSSITNKIIDDLVRNEDTISRSPALMESIMKLRDINLLKEKAPLFQTYQGVGKINYVLNDFHSRNTNPGYSRNKLGTHFCH